MDAFATQSERLMGCYSGLAPGFDIKQIFFTNLQLLGFDSASMEIKYKIPFNKEMFNLPNKAGAEAVLYFLFGSLNPTLCRQEFRDCWPVMDKKSESTFRKVCCIWLQNIQKEEADSRLPRINASLFLSPGGDKFYQLLFSFSTYVLFHVFRTEYCPSESLVMGFPALTIQNKELGKVMETTCTYNAVRHRKHFFETLGQIVLVKNHWQKYSDNVANTIRILSKEGKDQERSKRDQVHEAAVKGVSHGSPIPASRELHDFSMLSHTARRAQRVQQVRTLWKGLETYMHNSSEEWNIVSSIVDRTLQRYAIDAATINISIPHLMLRECEQEIRRRNVENIYEGGKLNLVSILQLWNLALRMYTQRLNEKGLRDLSDEANNLKSQVHSHRAYLANTAALREKMGKEVLQRKRNVDYLRRNFSCSEVTRSGPEMIAPSPPVIFEPSRGHTGATPTGPVLPKTPDHANTPEAAMNIADMISQSSRKNQASPFQTTAFGITGLQNFNRNNSNASRIPQSSQGTIQPTNSSSSNLGVAPSRTSISTLGREKDSIQPQVIRHVSRQTPKTAIAHKKPATKALVKTPAPPKQHVASSKEKAAKRQPGGFDFNPLPLDCNNSATQTPQQRAHDILADKIVWSMMHDEKESAETPHSKGLKSLPSRTELFPGASVMLSSLSLSAPHFKSTTPVQKPLTGNRSEQAFPSTTISEDSFSATLRDFWKTPLGARTLSWDSNQDDTIFDTAKSPVTLVQQDWLKATDVKLSNTSTAGSDARTTSRKDPNGQLLQSEEEDANIQNPVAAFDGDAFVSHDLIHRSPAASHIQHMWKEALSSNAENQDLLPGKDPATRLGSNTSNSISRKSTNQQSTAKLTDLTDEKRQQSKDQSEEDDLQLCDKIYPVPIKPKCLFSLDSDDEPEQKTVVYSSSAELEEHLSALYGDDDAVESEHADRTNEPTPSLHTVLNELFQTRTPVQKIRENDTATENTPLILFTPQNTLQSVLISEKHGDLQDRKHIEDMSDKENLGSPKLEQPVVVNGQHSVSTLTGPQKTYLTKKVTFSPDSSLYSYVGLTVEREEDRNVSDNVDNDLISTSGASLLDESFTPLRDGLFVHGTSGQGFILRQGPVTVNVNQLDEDVATQLSRLRKITAEALSLDSSSAVAEGQETTAEIAGTKDQTLPQSRTRPVTVGRECEDSELDDILGKLAHNHYH